MASSVVKVTKADFFERHELFHALLEELEDYNIQDVADISGVAVPTLYSWLQGRVMAPSSRTLFAVAEAMGYRLEWRRFSKGTSLRRRLYLVK